MPRPCRASLLFAALSLPASLSISATLSVSLSMSPLPAQEPPAAKSAPAAQEAPATIALSGRVVDGAGKPIAGAAVAFAPPKQMTTAQLLAKPEVRTGDDGRFVLRAPTLADVDASEQPVLLIAAKGFASVQPPIQWQFAKNRSPKPGVVVPRLDTDLGDLALPDGARLFGRVRDADGKGVADCVVTLRDLFDGQHRLRGPQSHVHCRAVSDKSGIFELPCGLAVGAAVDFVAKGFHRAGLPAVTAGAPLEVTLTAGQRVAGRVVDDKGGLCADASVWAVYERRGGTTPVRTAADGTFELWTEQPGRFRVHARANLPKEQRQGRKAPPATQSALQNAAVPNLELTLPSAAAPTTPANADGTGTLTVQAVAKGSKEPIVGMRAISVWQEFARNNAAYLEYLGNYYFQSLEPSATHETTVSGPSENEGQTGTVVVRAPGFAPTTVADVAWPEGEALATAKPLLVEMAREATIVGRVLDETSGAPIAGATVFARRKNNPNQGSFGTGDDTPESAVETADDGSYRLAELGEGEFQMFVRHPQRPRPSPIEFALTEAEQKQGLDVRLAAGARVAGRIVGIDVPAGSKVFLHAITTPRFGAMTTWSSGGLEPPKERTAVAADGSFAIDGVALQNWFLVLELPRPPRGGSPLFVPIEPLRLRAGGLSRDFDLGIDRPGRVRGTLRYERAVPEGLVPVVVAEAIDEQNERHVFHSQFQHDGPRALAANDGTFELPIGSGPHRLHVVDGATGTLLATLPQRLEVGPNGELRQDVPIVLNEVTVTLSPPADSGPFTWCDRLEIRHQPAKQDNNNRVVFAGNEEYEMGGSVPIAPGQTTVRLWLPEGKATLLARGSSSSLQMGRSRSNTPALGRVEVDLGADEKGPKAVLLEVGAPPAIEEPETKPAEAAGGR